MTSNNTVPTLVVDKNGKTTTVHKRVDAQTKQSTLPAPSLPPTAKKAQRGPVAKQEAVTERKVSWTEATTDADLRRVCIAEGINTQVAYSDVEMYRLISVVKSARNAELLMSAGIKTPDEAIGFLKQMGLPHLIEDSSDRVAEAIERRIPVKTYMNNEVLRVHHATEHLMDALEISSHKSVIHLRHAVVQGDIKLSDIKAIGYKNVSMIDTSFVKSLLKEVASGSSGITAKDIVAMRAVSYTDLLFNTRLKIAMRHGPEVAIATGGNVTVGLRMSHVLEDRGITDQDYARGFVKFTSELHSASTDKHGYAGTKYSEEDYFLYYDTGLTVEQIIEQGISREQAKAMNNGSVNSAVVSGWL